MLFFDNNAVIGTMECSPRGVTPSGEQKKTGGVMADIG
jgi:hypothetical protein